jgi:hypothetical protein
VKYLCLAFYDEETCDALSPAEWAAIASECQPHDRALAGTGRLVSQMSLGTARSSRSLRPGNGKPLVTDGPFVETKEQVGGFFIVEARDMDEAVGVAAKHPAANLNGHLGWGIEVRPIEELCRAVVEGAPRD